MSLTREWFGDFSLLRRPGSGGDQVAVHFAHATGFNAYTYAPLFESLDPRIDLYALDARGHGFSRARAVPKELRSWKPFVVDLEAFIREMPSPFVLAGHSMGGAVSLKVAARNPEKVGALVLADPVLPPPQLRLAFSFARATGATARLPIAQGAAKRRVDFPSRDAAVDNFVGKGAFRTWPREWIEAYVDGGIVEVDGGVRLSCARAWESRVFATADPWPRRYIKRLRCPTTLIARQKASQPLPVQSLDAFVRVRPDTRLLRLDASHFMTMERPDLVRDEIHRAADSLRSKL